MLRIFAFIIAAMLSAMPGPATAQQWIHFHTAPVGSVWSFDTATVNHVGDGTVEVWARSNERRNPTVSYRWARRRYSIDCARREITPMQYLLYAPDGRIVRSEMGVTRRGDTLTIAPGSMSDALRRAVCRAEDSVANDPHGVLGIKYDRARERLIAAGFTPIRAPESYCLGGCAYPETDSCSGTGQAFCSYRWMARGERYRLTTRDGEGGDVVWFGRDNWDEN